MKVIKKWILKAFIQKAISFLPFNNKLNFIFQKYVTKGVYLVDEYFFDRLGHARDHIKAYKDYSSKNIPVTCLELGTGWYPIVPISFYLIGSEKIYSVDISFLTSKERIQTTIKKFIEANDKGLLKNYFDINENRLEKLILIYNSIERISLEDLIMQLNMEYLIQDARHLELPDNSIDLVNSNNTFEHIYPEILISILKDFKRVVNKDHGVLSHFIDMSDHFAHFDKSINIYNFLQFSDKQWYWIDNSIQPQSRLRIDDYKLIYKNLDIPISAESFREGRINELKAIKLNDKFLKKPLEMIAISHCHFISKMGK